MSPHKCKQNAYRRAREKSQRESLHTAVKTSPVMSIKCARCGEASHMSMCQCVWRHLCGVSLLVSGIVWCMVGG